MKIGVHVSLMVTAMATVTTDEETGLMTMEIRPPKIMPDFFAIGIIPGTTTEQTQKALDGAREGLLASVGKLLSNQLNTEADTVVKQLHLSPSPTNENGDPTIN